MYIESLLLILVSLSIICYYYKEFSYWDKKRVPNVRPLTPFGNVWKCFFCLKNVGDLLTEYYATFKSRNEKFFGIYYGLGPLFVPINVDLIRRILIVDFEYFGSRIVYNNYSPFQENLYCLGYTEWKQLKPKFSAQFLPEKLKILQNLIYTTCKSMNDVIRLNQNEPINITTLSQRYTLDVIQEWFVGNNEDNLHKNDTEGQRILPKLTNCTNKDLLLTFYREGIRNPGSFLKAIITNGDVIKYFTKLAVTQSRPFKSKGSHSNVFMNNLITVIYNKSRHHVNYVEIASYLCSFYLNALNTIPFNLSICLYVLGNDQYLQDNVRREIITELQRNNKKMKHKSICNMRLLDGIIFECFRMYPIDFAIQRTCIKTYKVHGTDDVVLNKGTRILIPLAAYNYDPDVYKEPTRFNPYRYFENDFANEQIINLHFGVGPRQCLGWEFGMLIIKTALAMILKEFRVLVDVGRTGKRIKTQNVTKHYMYQYKNKIWLNFEAI